MGPDDITKAVDLGRQMLLVTIKLSFPLLMVGLIVGLAISILQAATQVQEQTLAVIPKMFAVVLTLFVILPWLLIVLVDYTNDVIAQTLLWIQQYG